MFYMVLFDELKFFLLACTKTRNNKRKEPKQVKRPKQRNKTTDMIKHNLQRSLVSDAPHSSPPGAVYDLAL